MTNQFELSEPSPGEFTYVDISISLTSAYPETCDGELVFNETSHDHYIDRVKIPADYASDENLIEKYIKEILFNSDCCIAGVYLYNSEISTI